MVEIGRVRKNETTEVRVENGEYKGSVGISAWGHVTFDRYTGWSKSGLRIPADKWTEFKAILDKVNRA
jgi:hypothetical protein